MPLQQLARRTSQAILASVTSHRIAVYALVSTIGVLVAILNALQNHSNFYSVAIYLSKSSRSVLVLANFSFLLALLGGHIVQRIFFGSLRPNEVERLYDRLWFFITESLLAFTIFRDEFDISFALMFGFLLFVKSFHWLVGDRIEWMDQRPYPGPPLLFHLRMTILFAILWMTDFIMFLVAVESTLANAKVGGMVLFASEYGILMASVTNTIAKYLLSAYDFRRAGQRGGENAPPWENKSMWVFYIELATDFFKLTTYLLFFTIIIAYYGLPLNIVRDVYITARSFITRLRALHRYQTATRNMDQRYPNATQEELAAMSDHTCIICREEMVLPDPRPAADAPQTPAAVEGPNMTPKKLPCGHIFHFHCLRAWLERQQSCPTCRRNVLEDEGTQTQRPARPAAGPVPQQGAMPQPNPFVQPGAQDGQAGNNPVGLVGRIFGVQPPPPGARGRNIIPNVVNGQNGVVIQYNIQYQLPRDQGHNPRDDQAPQPLQPPPQFDGFQGPGGVWQPWPQRDPGPANEPPAASLPEQANGGAINGHNVAQNNNASTPAEQASDPSPALSPREAAAQAAARRMGLQNVNLQPRPSPSTPTSSAVSGVPTPDPSVQINSSTSTIPAESPELSGQSQRLDIPTLIPLSDIDLEGTPMLQTDPIRDTSTINSPQPFSPHSRETMDVVPASSTHGTGDAQTSITSLPPTLTDEQLASLDRLTREAIDERLRVLEGVSTAVYHCIDELIRMRSALPTSSTGQSANPVVRGGQQSEESQNETRDSAAST